MVLYKINKNTADTRENTADIRRKIAEARRIKKLLEVI